MHSRGLTCVATLHHSRPCPCTLRLSCLKMLLLLSLKATAAHILSLSLSRSPLSFCHPHTQTHARTHKSWVALIQINPMHTLSRKFRLLTLSSILSLSLSLSLFSSLSLTGAHKEFFLKCRFIISFVASFDSHTKFFKTSFSS